MNIRGVIAQTKWITSPDRSSRNRLQIATTFAENRRISAALALFFMRWPVAVCR
jgi:hypothetical protein